MNTAEMMVLLRARYSPPEYALFTELANGTGGHCRGWADAVAMSLWPSRGLELIGLEVKVSRADWQREMRNPAKAEPFVSRCDRWYLVAAAEIVAPGELPPTWGLMVPKSGKLVVTVEAPKLEPKPVDRPFLASLFRHAHAACAAETQLTAAEAAGYQRGFEAGKKRGANDAEGKALTSGYELERLQRLIQAFQDASGVDIKNYRAGQIGEAVKIVLDGKLDFFRREIAGVRGVVRRLHEALQEPHDG